MRGNYYFLYVNTESGKNPSDQIEKALGSAEWARLRGGDLYIVYSDKTIADLRELIQPFLTDKDHFLIGEFNKINHRGYLSASTVNWINKDRE